MVLQRDELGSAVPARDDMLRQLAMDARGLRLRLRLVEEIGVFDFHLGVEREKRGNRGVFAFFVLLVHLASEAEIDDFGNAAIADEDVGWLEVAMDEIATLQH